MGFPSYDLTPHELEEANQQSGNSGRGWHFRAARRPVDRRGLAHGSPAGAGTRPDKGRGEAPK
jgi:hypothetical protein